MRRLVFHLFFMMVSVVNGPIFEVNIKLTSTRHNVALPTRGVTVKKGVLHGSFSNLVEECLAAGSGSRYRSMIY